RSSRPRGTSVAAIVTWSAMTPRRRRRRLIRAANGAGAPASTTSTAITSARAASTAAGRSGQDSQPFSNLPLSAAGPCPSSWAQRLSFGALSVVAIALFPPASAQPADTWSGFSVSIGGGAAKTDTDLNADTHNTDRLAVPGLFGFFPGIYSLDGQA